MASDSISRLLFNYLIQKGSMAVPGFGGFRVERIPAKNDFASKQILPPSVAVVFDPELQQAPGHQLEFLAGRTGKPLQELEHQLSKWGQRLSETMQTNLTLTWPGLGEFNVGSDGKALFSATPSLHGFELPVGYTHVLREHIQHSVKVGEDERTNVEMESYFEEQRSGLSIYNWKSASILLLILITLLLGYRFTLGSFDLKEHRLNPIKPQSPYPTYRNT